MRENESETFEILAYEIKGPGCIGMGPAAYRKLATVVNPVEDRDKGARTL